MSEDDILCHMTWNFPQASFSNIWKNKANLLKYNQQLRLTREISNDAYLPIFSMFPKFTFAHSTLYVYVCTVVWLK